MLDKKDLIKYFVFINLILSSVLAWRWFTYSLVCSVNSITRKLNIKLSEDLLL